MPRDSLKIKMVAGNHFGRYSKISIEETFNMIVSQGALVDYAGYRRSAHIDTFGVGRGGISSARANKIFCCVGSNIYQLDTDLNYTYIGSIATTSGRVFFAENNNNEIAISDLNKLYIYNYSTGSFTAPAVSFIPGAIFFHNGRFLTVDTLNQPYNIWRLSEIDDGLTWPTQNIARLQTKPDRSLAAFPIPGKGNMIFVMGNAVTEQWTDVGNPIFPYQRSSSFNMDFGCINPATIAILEETVAWVGGNKAAGISIFVSTGGELKKLSTEGIDYKLQALNYPQECSGFMFKQDGHTIYQITWEKDNLSYIYDFSSGEFFTVTNENLDFHIAETVLYFNNKYYFLSKTDNYLYEFSSQFTTLDGNQMPRIRITPPARLPSQDYFILNNVSFTCENGQFNVIENSGEVIDTGILCQENFMPILQEDMDYIYTWEKRAPISDMAIDMAISVDGGVNFSSSMRNNMNPIGVRKSKMIWWNLGMMNDLTFKFRFNGSGRYVIFDGMAETL